MKLYTTRDVAKHADTTPDAIRKAVRRNQLRAIRAESGVMVFRASDVARWMKRRRRTIGILRVQTNGDAA